MKTKHLFFFLIIIFTFAAPAFALDRVIDNAGLLSAEQKESLRNLADSLSQTYNFDLIIVTERDIGSATPAEFADGFFEYKDYGAGPDQDGCVFLQVTESRDYRFGTSGRGEKILNPTAWNKLESDTLKYLGTDPYRAYRAFLQNWETFLALDAKGRNYNFIHRWNLVIIAAVWALAFMIGFLVVQAWKSGMNTVLPQTEAAAYMVPGSLAFKEKKDRFLYSTVNKTKRQTQSTSSGGISSVSSGRKSSGRGGKY